MSNIKEFKNIHEKWFIKPKELGLEHIKYLQKSFKENYINKDPQLENIIIEVTRKCNLNCIMCPISEKKLLGQELENLTFEEYKNIIDHLPSTIKNVTPNGIGEASLNKDFLEMLKYTKLKGYNLNFNTNGIFFDNEFLNYSDEVIFSLDSLIKEDLEKIRTHVNYDKLLEKIFSALKYKIENKLEVRISITSVLSYINYKDIKKLYEFCSKNKVDNLYINVTANMFSYKTDKFINQESFIEKNKEIDWEFIANSYTKENYTFNLKIYYPKANMGICSFGFSSLFIDNNMNVSLCCIRPRDTIIGNLKIQNWNDILNSEYLNKYKQSQETLENFSPCTDCLYGIDWKNYKKTGRWY